MVHEMKNNFSFRWLFIPLVLLSFLGFALFVERTGQSYDLRYSNLKFLEPLKQPLPIKFPNASAESLVLYDSEGVEGSTPYETVRDTLNSMRVRYDSINVAKVSDLKIDNYETVVIAFTNLNRIQTSILELADWVENGGRVLFAIRPDPSQSFSSIYRKMGILSKNDQLALTNGIHFTSDLLPGAKDLSIGTAYFHHSSIPIQLEDNAIVHLTSADNYQLPLLWEYKHGQGRFVFINSDQFSNKSSRGIVAAAYSLLKDITVFPVINSSMFYIDDFPSPMPQGENEFVFKEYGRNNESFFRNIWWPDMQSLARKYGLRYTGAIIATYNDLVNPPFDTQYPYETFNYFGSSVLNGGGEIGLHGYNHIPLCLEETGFNLQAGYPGWPSEENMHYAIDELNVFAKSLFPDQPFYTYVPAANMLCAQTRTWLPQAIPGLKVIASVYLPEPAIPAYIQEFSESADGIVELPRLLSGYDVNEYMQWTTLNEIFLHYVYAHFVHPYDILDKAINKGQSWEYFRNKLDDHLLWVYSSAPQIRNMTAREGAMAVQRFTRLEVNSKYSGNSYVIELGNFYDQAYLMMRSTLTPESIEGGKITKISSNLFLIEAQKQEVIVNFNKTPVSISGGRQKNSQRQLISVSLPTIVSTAEDEIQIGSRVVVHGTERQGLRLRQSPGTGSPTIFYAIEGDFFKIVDGPWFVANKAWWKIQDEHDPKKVGWSIQDFLLLINE